MKINVTHSKNIQSKLIVFGLIASICFIVNPAYLFAGGGNPEEAYLAFAEVMPEPTDGYPSMFKKIVYPDIAKNAGVEGKVYLLAYVNENGGVDDVKIVKSLGAGCDEAAIKAIKATKFNPGKNANAPIKVKLSIPVTFKLK